MRDLIEKVGVPEGTAGNWTIERFEITEDGANSFNLSCLFGGHGNRSVEPGTYTRLVRAGKHNPLMSDTPAEMMDHLPPVREATGHCLIVGLGIGMVVEACLRKPEVTKVTVIEIDADIISLVEPYLTEKWGDRIEIIQANIFEWKPPKDARYGMAWFDIWWTICTDHLPEMAKLSRRFTRKCDWYGHWGQRDAQDMQRRDRESSWCW